MTKPRIWHCRDKEVDVSVPQIMGIVNVTPDSFSDGGEHATYERAVAFARKLQQEGADILDIGGESTRPGAVPVSLEEELNRILRVVETLVADGFTVSVDTYKPQVMRASLSLGAQIINDVKALTEPGAIEAVRGSGCGIVLMHFLPVRENHVFDDIPAFLRDRTEALFQAGIQKETICWDPGFGFGKTMQENLDLLARFEDFSCENFPLLVGVSRKRMIGALTGIADPAKRSIGSVQAAVSAVEKGANIVRVHDVRETVEEFKRRGWR